MVVHRPWVISRRCAGPVTVDSASLGAIEPFALLDLTDERDLSLALGTLRAITERLDVARPLVTKITAAWLLVSLVASRSAGPPMHLDGNI